MIEGSIDWKAMALECRDALKLMHAHYIDDLAKSNPGFLGKLVLQDYGLMNEAFIAERAALDKYGDVRDDRRLPIVGVIIEGGVLQEAISEIPVRIMVIDGDTEGADLDEMAMVVDLEGKESEALASIWDSHVDQQFCLENEKRIHAGMPVEDGVDD
jgi:hypothetical protein